MSEAAVCLRGLRAPVFGGRVLLPGRKPDSFRSGGKRRFASVFRRKNEAAHA